MGAGRAMLDFGASPGATDTSIAVAGESDITADVVVHAWLARRATDDHTADEHTVESIRVTVGDVVAGTGFTIYGVATDGTRRTGKWAIDWSWEPRL